MGIRVRRTFRPLTDIKLTDALLMEKVGTFVVEKIRARTESQRDVHGHPFRALSPAYAKQKAQAIGSSAPDLTVSGRMLNALAVTQVSRKQVTIGFNDSGSSGSARGSFIQRSRAVSAAEKAYYHNVTGAGRSQVKREFLGISQADQKAVIKIVEDHIAQAIKP